MELNPAAVPDTCGVHTFSHLAENCVKVAGMKWVGVRIVSLAGCLWLGSLGLAQDLEVVKQTALETVKAIQGVNPGPLIPQWPADRCDIEPKNLYAGKPFLIRDLIRPTESDLERLRRRVEAARRENPDFVGDAVAEVVAARASYRDYYQVPIFHRTCGYMFHVIPGDEKDGGFGWGPFKPITAARAQKLLGTKEPPTFAEVRPLSFLRGGQL